MFKLFFAIPLLFPTDNLFYFFIKTGPGCDTRSGPFEFFRGEGEKKLFFKTGIVFLCCVQKSGTVLSDCTACNQNVLL